MKMNDSFTVKGLKTIRRLEKRRSNRKQNERKQSLLVVHVLSKPFENEVYVVGARDALLSSRVVRSLVRIVSRNALESINSAKLYTDKHTK